MNERILSLRCRAFLNFTYEISISRKFARWTCITGAYCLHRGIYFLTSVKFTVACFIQESPLSEYRLLQNCKWNKRFKGCPGTTGVFRASARENPRTRFFLPRVKLARFSNKASAFKERRIYEKRYKNMHFLGYYLRGEKHV